jgi:hypothetical protein
MNRLIGRGDQPTANLLTCALSANPLISKTARTGTGRMGDGQSCPIRVRSPRAQALGFSGKLPSKRTFKRKRAELFPSINWQH